MKFLLVMILMTKEGPVDYTERFEFNYKCVTAMNVLKHKFPGSTGECIIL